MKKKLIILFCLVNLLFHTPTFAKNPQIPPIPKEPPHTRKVAIVTLAEGASEDEREAILHQFPDLQLRKIYKYALNGFSVEGTIATLEKLAKTNHVDMVSQVKSYKANEQPNMQIIGANDVRGLFDQKHQRLTGKGITIGVIDTGIDYNHPDLGRNYKGGHDLVDEDDDPMETQQEEGPPTLHGTHVAGIIAANGHITGVAPEANIKAYRALGPGGSGTTEQVLAAIEEAIKDKVDILNLSLGNSINGPDLPISLALNNAVDRGIVAVASSGNSGPNMWTVGSPGTSSKAISVGASTPPIRNPYLSITGVTEKLKLEVLQGSIPWDLDRTFELADGGLGKREQLGEVKGKITLIERGELTFAEKAENALAAGAKAVIIYNNLEGSFLGNLDRTVELPVATMSKELGEKIIKLLEKKSLYAKTVIKEEMDLLSDFSSRGPVTGTWEIKPDVVAPGVAITSTVPDGYLSLQGTSMAAPHVAGAVALIKQARPTFRPSEIKAAIMNTAKPLTDATGKMYRTYEQGAGRIQIKEAIQTKSLVIPSSLHFGKFLKKEEQQVQKQYITIKNVSEKSQHYSFLVPEKQKGIHWELPLSFHLEPNESKQVEIKMIVDDDIFAEKVSDGYLILQAGSQKISLPYLYVVEEPDYPRVMGFDFAAGDEKGAFRYEVYLPGGAEEFGIALFEPDGFRFVGFLDTLSDVGKGLLQREIAEENLPESGLYLAKVFARLADKEDMLDSTIFIYKEGDG